MDAPKPCRSRLSARPLSRTNEACADAEVGVAAGRSGAKVCAGDARPRLVRGELRQMLRRGCAGLRFAMAGRSS
jgi:hypothetical protein